MQRTCLGRNPRTTGVESEAGPQPRMRRSSLKERRRCRVGPASVPVVIRVAALRLVRAPQRSPSHQHRTTGISAGYHAQMSRETDDRRLVDSLALTMESIRRGVGREVDDATIGLGSILCQELDGNSSWRDRRYIKRLTGSRRYRPGDFYRYSLAIALAAFYDSLRSLRTDIFVYDDADGLVLYQLLGKIGDRQGVPVVGPYETPPKVSEGQRGLLNIVVARGEFVKPPSPSGAVVLVSDSSEVVRIRPFYDRFVLFPLSHFEARI